MKTTNKFKLNNKGAALISVMIAVAFVTILSTTLLYISLNNYQMKVVNTKSKENFYDADDKMVTMTTRLQNTVATTKGSQIKTKVMTTVGCSGVTTTTDLEGNTFETGFCTGEALAKIVFPTVNDGTSGITGAAVGSKYVVTDKNKDKYEFNNAIYTFGPKLKADGTADGSIKQITLQDVEIRKLSATSAANSVSETSFDDKISTDMTFEYYEPVSSPNDGGVGTFSLLMDNCVSLDESQNVRLNIHGNGYMSKYNTSNMSTEYVGSDGAVHKLGTQPGSGALVVGENGMINALGDNLIVYGDCEIKNKGVLNIAHGSLTVYGNLYVRNGGTLLVGGDIYMSDETAGAGVYKYSYVVEAGGVVKAADPSFDVKRINPEPLKHALKLDDTDASNDGVVANITKPAKRVTGGSEKKFYEMMDSCTSVQDIKYDGKTYYVKFFNQAPLNAGDLSDSLCFMGSGHDYLLRDRNVNATIISQKPIKVDERHVVDLTCIGDGVFNYMTGKTGSNYNVQMQVRMEGAEGKYNVGEFFKDDANAVAAAMLGGATGGGGGSSDPTPAKVTSCFDNWKKN